MDFSVSACIIADVVVVVIVWGAPGEHCIVVLA